MSLKLSYVRGAGVSSRAIGWFSSSDWSHVDIVLDSGLLGARSDNIGGGPGVRIRPFDYESWQHRLVMEIPCTEEQAKRGWDFLNEQIGKPYDRLAIVAFAIDRNWRDEGAWFCSELATRYQEVALQFDLPATPNKITPGASACITGALGGKVLQRY